MAATSSTQPGAQRLRRQLLVAAAAGPLGACASGLQRAPRPEEAGLSAPRLQALSSWLQGLVDRHEIPGAVALIARHGRVAYFGTFGFRDREAAAPMTRDAIFRIASMSKPVTSVVAMTLVEQGRLSLAAPVARYLPEFAGAKVGVERAGPGGPQLALETAPREMTVHDLLRHTSGLTYGFIGRSLVKDRYNAANLFDPALSLAAAVVRLATLPLQNPPGSTWDYGMSTDVLGRLIEVASGTSLERAFAERIFQPLGMRDSAFTLADAARLERLAQPQVAAATGRRPHLPDPARPGWPSGGGGLVSTAEDYGRFCQLLLNGGALDGVRLLSPATVAQMLSDQLPAGTRVNASPFRVNDVSAANGHGFGLGFAVRVADGRSGFPGTVGDASWTGGYGTQFWIDPRKQLYAVLLMQLAPLTPAQPLAAQYWLRMRERVYAALVENG